MVCLHNPAWEFQQSAQHPDQSVGPSHWERYNVRETAFTTRQDAEL